MVFKSVETGFLVFRNRVLSGIMVYNKSFCIARTYQEVE